MTEANVSVQLANWINTGQNGGYCESSTHVFQRLSAIFPNNTIPLDRSKRCSIVEEWEDLETGKDIFDELDGCFYQQAEDLNALVMDYVRNHKEDFALPSDEIVARFKRRERIQRHCCQA